MSDDYDREAGKILHTIKDRGEVVASSPLRFSTDQLELLRLLANIARNAKALTAKQIVTLRSIEETIG